MFYVVLVVVGAAATAAVWCPFITRIEVQPDSFLLRVQLNIYIFMLLYMRLRPYTRNICKTNPICKLIAHTTYKICFCVCFFLIFLQIIIACKYFFFIDFS